MPVVIKKKKRLMVLQQSCGYCRHKVKNRVGVGGSISLPFRLRRAVRLDRQGTLCCGLTPRPHGEKGRDPSDLSVTSTRSYRAHPPWCNLQQILPVGHREAGNSSCIDQAACSCKAARGIGVEGTEAQALRHLCPI